MIGFAFSISLSKGPVRGQHPNVSALIANSRTSPRRLSKQEHRTNVTALSACGQAKPHKLLILGGTGRVGKTAADFLASQVDTPLQITIAGRNRSRGERICSELANRHRKQQCVSFQVSQVNVLNEDELADAIRGCDTVLHTAGPFQRREQPGEVLKAALSIGRNYVDICDDTQVCQAD